MYARGILIAVTLLIPTPLAAQTPRLEFGSRVGGTILDGGVVDVSIPGTGPSPIGSILGGNAALHVTFYPSDDWLIEPQINGSLLTDGTTTFGNIVVGLQGLYMFSGSAEPSWYLGPNGAFMFIDATDVGSEEDLAVGFAFGHRLLPLENLSLRIEGFYREWIDTGIEELGASVVFGVAIF